MCVGSVDAAALFGGSGSDLVTNGGGDPVIDCGSGTDTLNRNGATVFRRCEKIQ